MTKNSFAWSAGAAIVLGTGIWAMHFIGMLAFKIDCGLTYDPKITAFSVLPAVLAAAVSLHISTKSDVSLHKLAFSSVIMGSGIGLMHFSGMAAVRLDGHLKYDQTMFVLSIISAISLSFVSVSMKNILHVFKLDSEKYFPLIGGSVLGAAVSSMHYIAMRAAYFMPDASLNQINVISPLTIAVAVAGVVAALLFLSLAVVILQFHLRNQQTLTRKNMILETIGDGVCGVDMRGEIKFINPAGCKILGHDPHFLLGKNLFDFAAPAKTDEHCQIPNASRIIDFLHGRETVHITETFLHKNGTAFPVRLTIPPQQKDEFSSCGVVVFSDITEQVKTDNRLNLLMLAVEQSPNAMIMTNQENIIEYVNPALENITGFKVNELIGRSVREILKSGETPAHVYKELWESLGQGKPWKGQFKNKTKSGRMISVDSHIWPIKDADGQGVHYLSIQEDVTEKLIMLEELDTYRKHLEDLVAVRTAELQQAKELAEEHVAIIRESKDRLLEHEEFLTTIADNIPSRVAYWDRGLICHFANSSYAKWFGFDSHEMIGKSMSDAKNKIVLEMRMARIEAAFSGEPQSFETETHSRPGKIEYSYTHYIPDVKNGDVVGIFVLTSDITKLKKAEFDLRDSNTELEKALTAATAANIAKGQFLANMSHEIRTPLNGVIGLTTLLQRRITDPDNVEVLRKIAQSGKHLLTIINDILDLSKIESGKMEIITDTFRIKDVLNTTLSMTSSPIDDKNVKIISEISSHIPEYVTGDHIRIKQCLIKYLSNAVKFTKRGTITLRVRKLDQPNDKPDHIAIRFEVEDTGIGIPLGAQKRLFSDFEQAENTTDRKFGGTGLGLAITRKLAIMMGGNADFRSSPGKGSLFWFDVKLGVPVEQSDSAEIYTDIAVLERTLSEQFKDARILMAEDNKTNQDVVIGMLDDVGMKAVVVENGRQAVDTLETRVFDLILMDMQMPIMDGLTAARMIRCYPSCKTVPIVALTANSYDEDFQKCIDAGMNDHLGKPVLPEVFYATLLKWLSASRNTETTDKTSAPAATPPPPSSAAPPPMDDETRLRRELGDCPWIDLDLGLKYNRLASRYIKILNEYANVRGDSASSIQSFLSAGDKDGAARVAHTLKGGSAMLGITGISELADQLEKAILNDADGTILTPLTETIEQRLNGISNLIRQMMA